MTKFADLLDAETKQQFAAVKNANFLASLIRQPFVPKSLVPKLAEFRHVVFSVAQLSNSLRNREVPLLDGSLAKVECFVHGGRTYEIIYSDALKDAKLTSDCIISISLRTAKVNNVDLRVAYFSHATAEHVGKWLAFNPDKRTMPATNADASEPMPSTQDSQL